MTFGIIVERRATRISRMRDAYTHGILMNVMSRVDRKNGGAFGISLGGHVVRKCKKADVCGNLLDCDATVFFVGLLR